MSGDPVPRVDGDAPRERRPSRRPCRSGAARRASAPPARGSRSTSRPGGCSCAPRGPGAAGRARCSRGSRGGRAGGPFDGGEVRVRLARDGGDGVSTRRPRSTIRALRFGSAPSARRCVEGLVGEPVEEEDADGGLAARSGATARRPSATLAIEQAAAREESASARHAGEAGRTGHAGTSPDGYRALPRYDSADVLVPRRRPALPLDVLGRPRASGAARGVRRRGRPLGARPLGPRRRSRPARVRGGGEGHGSRDGDRERALDAVRRRRRPRARPLPRSGGARAQGAARGVPRGPRHARRGDGREARRRSACRSTSRRSGRSSATARSAARTSRARWSRRAT